VRAAVTRDVLVAVDVGTSGARASAYDADGTFLAEARRAYPTSTPRRGWAEQDPRRWRSASLGALAALVRGLDADRVRAIALTGQCPTVMLADARGDAVSRGLIYRDNRATAEADAITARFGAAEFHRRTGHTPAPFHVVPKLLWLRTHEPDAFRRAVHALQPRDLVALALTGEVATDGTHAAATLVFDLRRRAWDHELMTALDLPPSLFPPVRASWETLGSLRPRTASQVGLRAGVPVVLGGADSQACALGAGVVGVGPVSEMAGSSTCLNAVVAEPIPQPAVTHYPHVIPGPLTTETGINTTGAAVAWLADLLYGGRGRATASAFARLDADAAAARAGADGLLSLPFLGDGERVDATLRGAFTGLSLRHDRGTLARALLEGTAFEIRAQLALLTECGVPVTELRVSGGDARLRSWNRIKADVTGVPVRVVAGDAAALGVAMLAGIGTGLYRDPAAAVARCTRTAEPIQPNAANRNVYDQAFEGYRALAASEHVRRRQ
jgi:xylulokinase